MYLNNCLYNYRINENSSTNKLDANASLEWFNNNIAVLDYISNNLKEYREKIKNIKFTRLCVVLRVLCKTPKITYKKFEKYSIKILEDFYNEVPKDSIDINSIEFTRKVDKIRAKMVLNNQLRSFYNIARLERVVLKFIR